MYNKQTGTLTREGAGLAIAQGGVVLHDGVIYRSLDLLPEELQPVVTEKLELPGDPASAGLPGPQTANAIDAEIARLQALKDLKAQQAAATGDTVPGGSPAGPVESGTQVPGSEAQPDQEGQPLTEGEQLDAKKAGK